MAYDRLTNTASGDTVQELIAAIRTQLAAGNTVMNIALGPNRGEFILGANFPRNKFKIGDYHVFCNDASPDFSQITCTLTAYPSTFYIKNIFHMYTRHIMLFKRPLTQIDHVDITDIHKFMYHLADCGPTLTYSTEARARELGYGDAAFRQTDAIRGHPTVRKFFNFAKQKVEMLPILAALFGDKIARTICTATKLV